MPTDDTVDFATAYAAMWHEGKRALKEDTDTEFFVREGRMHWLDFDGDEHYASESPNYYAASRWRFIEPPPPLPKLPKLFRAKVKRSGQEICGVVQTYESAAPVFVEVNNCGCTYWRHDESDLAHIRLIEPKE